MAVAVDRLSAAPGERVAGLVSVDLGPASVDVPVVVVHGVNPGPRVGITAGIHGAEYVPIVALRRVVLSLDPSDVSGSLVAVLISNPAAFAARSIYVNPLDGRNLHRAFPGDPAGGPSDRLAAWLFSRIIAPSDRYLDLHCGDMNEALIPFTRYEETGNADIDGMASAMAEAYGLDYICVGQSSPGTTTAAAARAGIPAVLAEVGGQGRVLEEDVALHAAGLRRALHAAGVIAEPPAGPRRDSHRVQREAWIRMPSVTGMFHSFVQAGDTVRAGDPLGEIQDPFGVNLLTLTAPINGKVRYLVTSLAITGGDASDPDPLLAISD